jgi:hypothetical protein
MWQNKKIMMHNSRTMQHSTKTMKAQYKNTANNSITMNS